MTLRATGGTDLPLRGARVLITRTPEDAEGLRTRLEELGAAVIVLPTVEILPPRNPMPLDAALRALDRFDWIAFTSRYAVRAVFNRLPQLGFPDALPPLLQVAAVGSATARELRDRGVERVVVPPEGGASSLARAMLEAGAAGTHVLIPAGDLARPELRQRLEAAGVTVEQVIAYRNAMPEVVDRSPLDDLCHGRVDVISVASPSAILNLAAMLEPDTWCLRRTRVACIGSTTARAAGRLGLNPVTAAEPTVDALVAAIVATYGETDHDER